MKHWAFHTGLSTLTTDYTVVLSPLVQRADIRQLERHDSRLGGNAFSNLSAKSHVRVPHPQALAWHAARVFRE